MTVNKGLAVAAVSLLVALLVCALVEEWRIGALKRDVIAQTTRAERAEEKVTALEAAAAYRETQLFALQGQAAQCEEARAQDAANAAERRAITGQARLEERQAAQGGIASPHILKGGTAHDTARRAVADRLNRPL